MAFGRAQFSKLQRPPSRIYSTPIRRCFTRFTSPPPANDGSVKMPFFTQLAHHFLPEVILAIGVLALILVGAWRGERSFSLVTELTVAVLGLAILAILLSTKSEAIVFDGAYIDDAFSRFAKVLTLSASLVTILLSVNTDRKST